MSELDWLDDEEYGLESATMTNADKIRDMTDEQLSVLLQMGACQHCAYASKNHNCCCPDNKNCRDGQLGWLKQEANNGKEILL